MRLRGPALDALAECFRFHKSQIEDAAETAANLADYRGESARVEHAFEAGRIRSGHELANLTRKVAPVHGWADIVLPQDSMEQLREICSRVAHRHQVLGKWGFERKLSGGKGVNALFHGHSGTGKTMAAEVVARELQLDLYKIDLAGVVSKYIGETEKNLDRIFAAAENANAILLFDEADALFGKRSEVRDSHDRYANLEVSYLLQKMEQHEGVSILATNLRQNLDDAFLRRLSFMVQFPFPDEASRRQIWTGIWPAETPLARDVDAGWLAARFLLSGGNIRNVALAAAYLAVEDGSAVGLSHVLRGVRGEFQKMGKTLTAAELAHPLVAQGATA
jgi:SpoVK/Ycf46/Vps4 family AAA+-type ATPase